MWIFIQPWSEQCLQGYQKISSLVRQCVPNQQKIYNITKRLRTPDEVEQYFPSFLAFIDSAEQQQIPRSFDNYRKKKTFYSWGGEEIHPIVKNQLVVNKYGLAIHKIGYKKGRKYDYIFAFTRINILS